MCMCVRVRDFTDMFQKRISDGRTDAGGREAVGPEALRAEVVDEARAGQRLIYRGVVVVVVVGFVAM